MVEMNLTDGELPRASVLDSLAVAADVFAPNIAKGVIIRRPKVVAMAERMELDRRAVRRMQQLRDRYGEGPLMLRVPGRSQAVVLSPEHVRRVLRETPDPFATASSEKRAALSHFEPKGALISHLPERVERRRYNEEVLESDNPVHHLAGTIVPVVQEEGRRILDHSLRRGVLEWDRFAQGWFRVVRRVVFGNVAADDHQLTGMMAELRSDANWAFLKPKRKGLRKRFFARMQRYLELAEPGSLAAVMARTRTTEVTAPLHQVPQWLFAFDPAGMATFRALALLAAHPGEEARAREEACSATPDDGWHLPFLRATVLESLRLWPTTPMLLRQTTRSTRWDHGVMPRHTGVLIFAPFFHRDDERLDFADRFVPGLWLRDRDESEWPLIPFSGGPGICPGRHLVLLLTSNMLATLIRDHTTGLEKPRRLPPGKLPGTLDNYSLRFHVAEL
jgi:hypothetical protein